MLGKIMGMLPGKPGGDKEKKKKPPMGFDSGGSGASQPGALGQIAQSVGSVGTVDAGGAATGVESGFAQAGQ